jgi:recombination protein RecA
MAFQKKPDVPKEPKIEIKTPETDLEKFKALFAISKMLDKKHETTNSLIKLGSKVGIPIPSIGTGLPSFDEDVLGCGGIPRGRIVEIFGPESAGKTTIALHVLGMEQKAGGICAFIDAEHALDPTYASKLGVNVDNLLINQPDNGEQALEVAEELVKSKCVTLIVVDSVAALVPAAELAGDMTDQNVGLQARLMSKAMRRLTGICATNNVTIIFINQIREKIGVMFGNPETTTGGRALKFYSSVRLDVRRREVIGAKEKPVGHHLEVKAVKNKVGNPFRSTVLDLYYPDSGHEPGLDQIGDLIGYASKRGLFDMSGSWYILGEERLANGLSNLKEALRDRADTLQLVRDKLKALPKETTL